MTLYPRLLIRLLDGRAGGTANVASVPTEVGVFFSALTRDVRITQLCLEKLLFQHRIKYEELEHIQNAINRGYIFAGRESKYLEFIYIDTTDPYRHYLLVLKMTGFGEEIWLQTFHRSDEPTLRSRLRKRRLLRPHL
jgi:hypothetical protein